MSRRGLISPLTRAALVATTTMLALTACGGEQAGPKLELTAALPDAPADGTTLRERVGFAAEVLRQLWVHVGDLAEQIVEA